MVNEKCRDAVDLCLILDSRDLARIGTVLKNPWKWERFPLRALRRFSSSAEILLRSPSTTRSCLICPQTRGQTVFQILMPLLAYAPRCNALASETNSLSGRFSRGSPVFIISSCEVTERCQQRFGTWLGVDTGSPCFRRRALTLNDW